MVELLTGREKARITSLRNKIKLRDKTKTKIIKKLTRFNRDIQKISNEQSKLHGEIYKIEARAQKRCKHQNGTYRQRNWRDDANYKYKVRCNDCHEVLDYEEENYGRYN